MGNEKYDKTRYAIIYSGKKFNRRQNHTILVLGVLFSLYFLGPFFSLVVYVTAFNTIYFVSCVCVFAEMAMHVKSKCLQHKYSLFSYESIGIESIISCNRENAIGRKIYWTRPEFVFFSVISNEEPYTTNESGKNAIFFSVIVAAVIPLPEYW